MGSTHNIVIKIFCDRSDMLSSAQEKAISDRFPEVEFIPWEKAQGWGEEQIREIWKAYGSVAERCGPDDYIARVDSDVFFFSDWIFDFARKRQYDLIGDGHYVGFKYCQGGFYLWKASAIIDAVNFIERTDFSKVLEQYQVRVEDRAAYLLAKLTGKTWIFLFYMMFPDEYKLSSGLGGYQRWKFCCLHYAVRDKAGMLDIYENEMLDEASIREYRAAIGIT